MAFTGESGHVKGIHSKSSLDQVALRVKVLMLGRERQEVAAFAEQAEVEWAIFWHNKRDYRENSILGPV